MAKPIPIIEYQNDKQRTPQEALDCVADNISNITHVIVIAVCKDCKTVYYIPGSKDRNYSESDILWDMIQWFKGFISRI